MRRTTNRNRREEDEYESRGSRQGGGREEREREFLRLSRRRDEGNYGRAYGSRQKQGDTRGDDYGRRPPRSLGTPQRRGSGGRGNPMGWGRGEEDDHGPQREREGYWSQSRRGEFAGRSDYGRGRRSYGGPDFSDYEDEPRFRGRGGTRGYSGPESDHDEEFEPPRGARRAYSEESDDDYHEERDSYRGGRHLGGNIGSSQMDYDIDYNEEHRRGGRGGSRWEDEDVITYRGSEGDEDRRFQGRSYGKNPSSYGQSRSGSRGERSQGRPARSNLNRQAPSRARQQERRSSAGSSTRRPTRRAAGSREY